MNRERRQSKRAMLEQPDTITLRAREKLVIEQRELISKVLSEVRHAGGDGVTLRSLTRQHHVSASEVLSVLVLLASLDLVDLRFAHGRARNGSATKHRWIATAVEPFGRELGYVELPVIPLPLDLAAFWVPALQRDRETVASASTALEHARSQRNTNHPNYAAIAHFQRQLDVAPALAALATEHLARMPYGKFDPDAYNANFEAPHSLSQ